MPQVPGYSDPAAVTRARRKLVAIRRAEIQLKQRLERIDWEEDVLKPELKAFESHIVTVGELPEITVNVEVPKGPNGNRKRSRS